MDQIEDDFGSVGLFDIRGTQNYKCLALVEGGHMEDMWVKKWGKPTCDVGPCTAGLRCSLKDDGCEYFDDYRKACGQRLVSTNYAYWIAINKYGQGLGKFDMLVLDEAHSASPQLSSALSVEFTPKEFKELGTKPPKLNAPLQNWRMWGRVQLNRVQGKLEFFTKGAKIGATGPKGEFMMMNDSDMPDASELKFWKKLEGKCMTLSESTDDWVVEHAEHNGTIQIAPAFIRNYAETHLFRNIPRIVLMSATIRPKTANLLGIPESQYKFTEYPSLFPVERRPIYWIPTVRLNHNSPDEDLRTWLVRIDQILARRLDRKGIIHTVSYERGQYLMQYSRFRHLMHANKSTNTRDMVKSFRDSVAPAFLVSPSVGTGWDFPYEQCRFQIIGKVPFRDHRNAILRVQALTDPDCSNYLTAQDLIQTYGRSNRAENDFSETFCVDDSVEWFIKRYAGYKFDEEIGMFDMAYKTDLREDLRFFPYYFLEAFQRIDHVPNPPALEAITC